MRLINKGENIFLDNVELNALVITLESGSATFDYYVASFNEYAKQNNLNITINLQQITENDSHYSLYNTGYMIENMLKKKNSKYDIYFFDNSYTKDYGPYLLNLEEYIEEDHINMYNQEILSLVARDGEHLVALPATIDFTGLFSNKVLLDKYDKRIPETWEELIETSKFIIEQERTLYNNTKLIAYNGLFDIENGIYSLIEFIHSCREDIDSPFPELTSQTAVEAIELIKRVKNEIASDDIFSQSFYLAVGRIQDRSALFVKFYYIPGLLSDPTTPYVVSSMPGIREGMSGTVLVGYNIGISNKIDKRKLKPAIEAVKFFTSEEMQKDLVLKEFIISGISTLYEEEEICSKIRFCKFYRYPQATRKPENKLGVNNYYEDFTKIFYKFLYGDEKAIDVLKKMDNLSKLYTVSTDTKDSYLGLIIFIIYICALVFIVLSLSFLFIKKFNRLFLYLLSTHDWLFLTTGIIMVLSSGITKFGELKPYKCHLSLVLLSVGFSFIYVPLLRILIITFPDDYNKYSLWVCDNKYIFYSIFLFIDAALNGLALIKPYEVKNVIVVEGNNFQICDKKSGTALYLILGYKFIFSLALLLLNFIEWNLVKIKIDVRLILSSMYLNIVTLIILLIFNTVEINNYISYYLIQQMLILLIAIANFVILYLFRLLIPAMSKVDVYEVLFEHFKSTKTGETSTATKSHIESALSNQRSQKSQRSTKTETSNSVFTKILEYHKKEYTASDINVLNSKCDSENSYNNSINIIN